MQHEQRSTSYVPSKWRWRELFLRGGFSSYQDFFPRGLYVNPPLFLLSVSYRGDSGGLLYALYLVIMALLAFCARGTTALEVVARQQRYKAGQTNRQNGYTA